MIRRFFLCLGTALSLASPAAGLEIVGPSNTIPKGYQQYCRKHLATDPACPAWKGQATILQASLSGSRIPFSRAAIEEIQAVNQAVNDAMIFDDGTPHIWRIPRLSHIDGKLKFERFRGACGDATVTKLHALLALGYPRDALRMTIARMPSGAHHMVLVVRMAHDDLVLDDLHDQLRTTSTLVDYNWMFQEEPSSGRWLRVRSAPPDLAVQLLNAGVSPVAETGQAQVAQLPDRLPPPPEPLPQDTPSKVAGAEPATEPPVFMERLPAPPTRQVSQRTQRLNPQIDPNLVLARLSVVRTYWLIVPEEVPACGSMGSAPSLPGNPGPPPASIKEQRERFRVHCPSS